MAKRTTINVDIKPELKRELTRRAKAEHLRPSDIVRKAIYFFLEANPSEKVA
jgi:hypothetical protein